MPDRVVNAAVGAIVPILLLIAWEFAATAGGLPKYVSSPAAIASALAGLAASGELTTAVLVSLTRAYAGFAIGAAAGCLAGLAAGLSGPVRSFFDPLVAFLYPIPKIALLPVFLLAFGLGHGSKIAIIAFSVFFPVFLACRHAVATIDRNLVWMAANMGAGPARIFWRVILPAAMPQLLSGMRIGLALSFVLLFVAELVGARDGLGYLVSEGQEALRFDLTLAAIFAFAIAGYISDAILMLIRSRLIRGQGLGTEEGAQ